MEIFAKICLIAAVLLIFGFLMIGTIKLLKFILYNVSYVISSGIRDANIKKNTIDKDGK